MMTSFSSTPFSPSLRPPPYSRVDRTFSKASTASLCCPHPPSLITLFSLFPPPLFIAPFPPHSSFAFEVRSPLSQSSPHFLAYLPLFSPFISTHLLLCLTTSLLPFAFIHFLPHPPHPPSLHCDVLCLPVCLFHKGLSEASALLIHSLCIASHICRVMQTDR